MGSKKQVAGYILDRRIGKGSYATVWKGHLEGGDEVVAVKVVSRQTVTETAQLRQEVDVLRRISHVNIVRFRDLKKSASHFYLVLEYCAGGDLSQFLRERGRVQEDTAKMFLTQIAAGLCVLHRENVIHRDLKPQNILLSNSGNEPVLKIADFGFARALQPQDMAATVCGSPLYMAPEILRHEPYDTRADLWSVGAILYELVLGRPPFSGANPMQLLANIEKSDRVSFDGAQAPVSSEGQELLGSLLVRLPAQRLSSREFSQHSYVRLAQLSDPREGDLLTVTRDWCDPGGDSSPNRSRSPAASPKPPESPELIPSPEVSPRDKMGTSPPDDLACWDKENSAGGPFELVCEETPQAMIAAATTAGASSVAASAETAGVGGGDAAAPCASTSAAITHVTAATCAAVSSPSSLVATSGVTPVQPVRDVTGGIVSSAGGVETQSAYTFEPPSRVAPATTSIGPLFAPPAVATSSSALVSAPLSTGASGDEVTPAVAVIADASPSASGNAGHDNVDCTASPACGDTGATGVISPRRGRGGFCANGFEEEYVVLTEGKPPIPGVNTVGQRRGGDFCGKLSLTAHALEQVAAQRREQHPLDALALLLRALGLLEKALNVSIAEEEACKPIWRAFLRMQKAAESTAELVRAMSYAPSSGSESLFPPARPNQAILDHAIQQAKDAAVALSKGREDVGWETFCREKLGLALLLLDLLGSEADGEDVAVLEYYTAPISKLMSDIDRLSRSRASPRTPP
eukprot:TRINITY_DN41004_c0_g1_i1.p1 TRINITY_DN41004_c0_g1~~TRINITY_DN41004_c0_g1_i1.p1  ORF type:complete len:748 (+),score=114.04 TRINITY_DN41004_c0_g1_i1:87-2330(+)